MDSLPVSSAFIVQSTNNDALISKASAVRAGYMQDPYTLMLSPRKTRKSPLLNRGSYVRWAAMDSLIRSFLSLPFPQDQSETQVVSFGAGSDTRYLQLKSQGIMAHRWFDVDFARITREKILAFKKHPECMDLLEKDPSLITFDKEDAQLSSPSYSILPGDLADISTSLGAELIRHGLDPKQPTLFIAECVIAYMHPDVSKELFQWPVANDFHMAAFLHYDPISPNDPFGTMMIHNLRDRGIELPGALSHPGKKQILDRFVQYQWSGTPKALTIAEIYEYHLSNEERARMTRLEMLDEMEEFRLLCSHYLVAWAYRGPEEIWSKWSMVLP
ncbi:MAG: S-adenosyl-L-methionine-dependent methyltransferase [Piptocephalis tieghemiana]|nr:MAG: S-adenosyl-L-methionine-dependent methyltransferase [Piptocephalis tieghemiana]